MKKSKIEDSLDLNLSLKPPLQPPSEAEEPLQPPSEAEEPLQTPSEAEEPLQSSLPQASSSSLPPALPNSVSPTMPHPASINNLFDLSLTSTSSTSTNNVGSPSPSTPALFHPNLSVALFHPNLSVAGPSTLTPVINFPNHNVGDSSPLTPAIVHPNPSSSSNPQPHYEQPGKRRKRNPTEGKDDIIPVPHRWATNRRATVCSLENLLRRGIDSIHGSVECKKCNVAHQIEFDLETKFFEVAGFILRNRSNMHDRAPTEWSNPLLPDCRFCGKTNCVKPTVEKKKKHINWLFLFLGQMLGCCTLDQLKYFCKHTRNHRTGAKDRVLYLTYITLAQQVDRRIT